MIKYALSALFLQTDIQDNPQKNIDQGDWIKITINDTINDTTEDTPKDSPKQSSKVSSPGIICGTLQKKVTFPFLPLNLQTIIKNPEKPEKSDIEEID
jgi:hypothetical protein